MFFDTLGMYTSSGLAVLVNLLPPQAHGLEAAADEQQRALHQRFAAQLGRAQTEVQGVLGEVRSSCERQPGPWGQPPRLC